jgi:ABC-2 type transport system permease protein
VKQFLVFVKKEFLHVFRDWKTLLLLFGMPVAQIVLFGFALSNEIKDARIIVLDAPNDISSQRIVGKIQASRLFRLEKSVQHPDEIEAAFKSGNTKLALIFPSGFHESLTRTGVADVQIITEGSDPNLANTLTSYLQTLLSQWQMESFGPASPIIRTEIRMLYNPELKGATNFVPGVMALVLLLICVLMTSVSIVKEKEMGTMEILLVSPFNPLLVVLSKLVPYFVVSVANLGVILVLSATVLDMPMNGSLTLLFAESLLLILTALSLGLLISNFAKTQQVAMLISLMGGLLPTMIFTGFMFPLENMPWPLQTIANLVPSKWYYIVVKDIMIKGLGLEAVWKETLILLVMTLFFLTVSIRNFKIRLT